MSTDNRVLKYFENNPYGNDAKSSEIHGKHNEQIINGMVTSLVQRYDQSMADNQNWYEPRQIYANVTIADNVPAYYSLAGDNINTLNTMMGQQPVLDGGIL